MAKKLLCIIDSLNVGGAETFLMKVMRVFSPDEFQFDFIVSKTDGAYEGEVLQRGGKIYSVPPRRTDFLGAFKGIYSVVKNNNYDYVLRLGDDPIVGIDLFAARFGGARHLAFRSCNALKGISIKTKILNAIMRPALNFIVNVKIAPSKLAAAFTFGKRSVKNVHILHNGVDLELFTFDVFGRDFIREEFSLQDKFIVGHIGRFNRQKNHRYLLEIFNEISKIRDDAVLFLVGDGEERENILEWIQELGLEKKIILVGQRFDIPQLLSAMDVFVFPSLYEGMPNTVIEAQATGLPCVIADTITPEADITGLVNYLSLADSADEWARVALSVANNPRKDTSSDLRSKGYDITSVANEFISLLGMNDTDL